MAISTRLRRGVSGEEGTRLLERVRELHGIAVDDVARALEERDALDVGGVGEHVGHPRRHQPVEPQRRQAAQQLEPEPDAEHGKRRQRERADAAQHQRRSRSIVPIRGCGERHKN